MICGGVDASFLTFYNDVYELDTTTFTWRKLYPLPDVSYSIVPPGRYAHTAHVIDGLMYVLFGYARDTTSVAGSGFADSSIHIFDFKRNAYVISNPEINRKTLVAPSAETNTSGRAGLIIGLVVAALVIVALLIVVLHRRSKRQRDGKDLERLRQTEGDEKGRDSDEY